MRYNDINIELNNTSIWHNSEWTNKPIMSHLHARNKES